MTRSKTFRLAAVTAALALPLAAAAGCGVAKQKSIKAEFASARTNLESSKAVAFTLRLDDAKGNALKLATKDGTNPALVKALLGGSVTYIADPVGDKTFKSAKSSVSPTDLKASLDKVNLAFVVRDDKAEVVELRLVEGNLYAHVNLKEISALAAAGGTKDFDSMLDQNLGQMDPRFAKALADVRAGKWLKLPLASYLDQLQSLAKGLNPALGAMPSMPSGKSYDASALGKKIYDAVKPYVKVTDANDSSSDRVLDVNVQVRPAVKAVLAALTAEKSLPFASMLGALSSSEIDKNISTGTAHGTITLKKSHLTQVAVDLESLRTLSTHPGTDSFAGVRIVVDVNDHANQLTAPTDLASVDLGSILDQFLQGVAPTMS